MGHMSRGMYNPQSGSSFDVCVNSKKKCSERLDTFWQTFTLHFRSLHVQKKTCNSRKLVTEILRRKSWEACQSYVISYTIKQKPVRYTKMKPSEAIPLLFLSDNIWQTILPPTTHPHPTPTLPPPNPHPPPTLPPPSPFWIRVVSGTRFKKIIKMCFVYLHQGSQLLSSDLSIR